MKYSPIESQRFGLKILRDTLPNLNPKDILRELDETRADVAMVRIPATEQHTVHSLERTGFPFIVADNLVYYKCNLVTYSPQPLRNAHLEFIRCDSTHHAAINELVDKCFTDYTNHYYSNPVLDKTDILEGYKEWSRGYATSDSPTQVCWLVRRGDAFIAFATCRFEDSECEGVLYGVTPEASGSGMYSDLIRFTQSYFKELGFKTMLVSTQVQNYAVQKVWGREGFQLANAYTTIHINALLGAHDQRILSITPDEVTIAAIGALSGDMNPIHFDDEAARQQGFEGKITHALFLNNILSTYFGTIYPGEGTIFAGYSYRFFKPLLVGRTYSFIFSYPIKNMVKGIFKSVVQVRDDANGDLCALAYADLINRKHLTL